MNCKFYGYTALRRNGELVATHGNQCALLYEAFAPCRMETAGETPDLEKCEMHGSARAIECKDMLPIREETHA
jgi:hypothetical protein